jgi:hypothetical protein
MDIPARDIYLRAMDELFRSWMQARDAVTQAASPTQLEQPLETLALIQRMCLLWSAEGAERHYQERFAALVAHTIQWAAAMRDGGDHHAAQRQMDEAHDQVAAISAQIRQGAERAVGEGE